MKKLVIVVMLMCFAFAKAYSQQPTPQDSTTVVETEMVQEKMKPADAVKAFFNHFHKKDTTAMREMMTPKITLHSLIISKSKGRRVMHTPITAFLEGIGRIPDTAKIEERLIQIKTTNSVDIASVNATYEFYVDDAFQHNGTNVFTLVYIDDKWMISGITDTRYYP